MCRALLRNSRYHGKIRGQGFTALLPHHWPWPRLGRQERRKPKDRATAKALSESQHPIAVIFASHPAGLGQDNGPESPECAARLHAVAQALEDPSLATLERRQVDPSTQPVAQAIALVHPPPFWPGLCAAAPKRGRVALDWDTFLSPGSIAAVESAVAAIYATTLEVCARPGTQAFCALRPPGHHAEPARAMGFCLVNTIAIAARVAEKFGGCRRVAVIDFDVHHGNGTEAAFWDWPAGHFFSLHQQPLYPGSGDRATRGPHGNIHNFPLPPGSDGAALRRCFRREVVPRIIASAPDMLLVSAGFDGHRDDPLAQWALLAEDYAWLGHQLYGLAARLCGGRLVASLEGGYNLAALAESAGAFLKAWCADDASPSR